ncbi:MAG: ribosome-recycling factor [Candidatus Kaiserbacteria bacterium]|nr:ribosome-recycling factor [Candidatus Kaiserbacteria bacterium]
MSAVTKEFSEREKEIIDWLGDEYTALQSGRATPAIVAKVKVQAYGATVALTHCATVSAEGATTLLVTPFDQSLIPQIESALREQVQSVTIAPAETSVRVVVPEMSGEQRELLARLVNKHAEEAKQSIRSLREKLLSDMKHGDLSEDESFRAKKDIQILVDKANESIDDMREKKVQDL